MKDFREEVNEGLIRFENLDVGSHIYSSRGDDVGLTLTLFICWLTIKPTTRYWLIDLCLSCLDFLPIFHLTNPKTSHGYRDLWDHPIKPSQQSQTWSLKGGALGMITQTPYPQDFCIFILFYFDKGVQIWGTWAYFIVVDK